MSPSGHCVVLLDSASFPPRVPHSSLSCTLCCVSELSSLHVTRNMSTIHHARLGGFEFDVVSSWLNCRNRYTDRSWRDDEQDEEEVHMLEDFLATGWTYQAYQETSKRNTCMEPLSNTKTIEDPTTLFHEEEKTKHTKSTSITQLRSSVTRTPLLASTCQQCHVKLCHELSWPHHHYGLYLL